MNIEFIQSQLKHCHWAYHPEHAEVPVEVILEETSSIFLLIFLLFNPTIEGSY